MTSLESIQPDGARRRASRRFHVRSAFGLLVLLAASACEDTQQRSEGPPAAEPIPQAWVDARVADSRARLEGSDAGRLLWRAIEAHGGLARWLGHGTMELEYDYEPADQPARRMHTFNEIDLWRGRARQRELGEGADAELGWDGARAWITPDPGAFPSPARFWATTPYYFVGIPFVLADPGTRHRLSEEAELDGVVHGVIEVTYDEGVGDSPGDYYVLYVHPETHRISAIRYVVAYPGFFPQGGHSPEKLMRYEDLREVGGLWMAHRFRTHTWDEDGGIGEVVTEIEASGYRFGRSIPADRFAPPPGAHVIDRIEPERR